MAIFDELKAVGKVLQEAGKIEQYQQILDAQQKLLEMQKRIAELEDENRTLKVRLTTRESLLFEQNAYWIEKGGERDGPFCSKCMDADEKLIRLRPGDFDRFGWARCPNCNGITPH